MNVLDLSMREGPMLLFGGPYSNFQATEALLAQVAGKGVAAQDCICTGDVVAYCGQPKETVALIRASGVHVVAGNCEKQLAAGAMDCGCGFEENSTCDLLSVGWFAHADRCVDTEARAWMGRCPDMITFTHHGERYAVIHGGVSDISRFLWPSSPASAFDEEIALIEAATGQIDVVVAGHCGIAFTRQIGRVRWVNAGAIGLPANNGQASTAYAMLSNGEVTFHGLDYDASAARNEMISAGLTQGYHDTLLSGYWPSEDVLPSDLRRAALASG